MAESKSAVAARGGYGSGARSWHFWASWTQSPKAPLRDSAQRLQKAKPRLPVPVALRHGQPPVGCGKQLLGIAAFRQQKAGLAGALGNLQTVAVAKSLPHRLAVFAITVHILLVGQQAALVKPGP